MMRSTLISALALVALSACGPSYSPDTYASAAAQQAAKVERGIVVGVRQVDISANTTIAGATGGAAGGLGASQVGSGVVNGLATLGGAVAGVVAGSTVGHAIEDTSGYEYIVRKPNGDLVSVTQKDATPLAVGARVLVIAGPQARIVADYTVDEPAVGAMPMPLVGARAP
jgi:outer membrane lipoprotein SlyB